MVKTHSLLYITTLCDDVCVLLFAGSAAQIPAFYMDTSHLFSTPHPRLAPPSLAQQQGFQPGLSQVGLGSCCTHLLQQE